MVLNLGADQSLKLNVHVVAEAAAFSAQLVWLERAPKFSVPQGQAICLQQQGVGTFLAHLGRFTIELPAIDGLQQTAGRHGA
jgi:hypothetical protein